MPKSLIHKYTPTQIPKLRKKAPQLVGSQNENGETSTLQQTKKKKKFRIRITKRDTLIEVPEIFAINSLNAN